MVEELMEQVDPHLVRRVSMLVLDKGLISNLKGYPTAVFFILGNEFCERFSFYGMRALLMLYFIIEHGMSESTATLIYHCFSCLAYISPLLGSVLADSYLGRFRVIFYVSIVYVIGHALLSVGAIPSLSSGARSFFDFSGLLVIALGTGGIKPCVSAFAADQFDDSQKDLRAQFFSFFYFAINAGSLFAIILTPVLRTRVKCFGSDYCFPLAFGVPGVLMLLAVVLFLSGWRHYKKLPPGRENVARRVAGCICLAAARKAGLARVEKAESEREAEREAERESGGGWLSLAAPNYAPAVIADVRSFVRVALIFCPLVLFWALFDQQGSTWVLQARRMDGRLGSLTVLPEQINLLNPLLILVLVPLFEGLFYPIIRKVFRVTPLRKMAAGGLLAALAFVMAGILQLRVNSTMAAVPGKDKLLLRLLNHDGRIPNETLYLKGTPFESTRDDRIFEVPAEVYTLGTQTLNFSQQAGKAFVLGIFSNGSISNMSYANEKVEGATRVYVLVEESAATRGGRLFALNHKNEVVAACDLHTPAFLDIRPPFISQPNYTLAYGLCSGVDCRKKHSIFTQMGAAHVLFISGTNVHLEELVPPNTVSVGWLLPQYIVITLGEVLLSVTGLEFAYSQSAPSMKSVLQALWLMTVFLGNLIDMAISGTHLIPEPATEFFVYAALMLLVMLVFIALATCYEYADEGATSGGGEVPTPSPLPSQPSSKTLTIPGTIPSSASISPRLVEDTHF